MPLTDQWQGFTGLPDFSDPPPIPTDIKAQFDFLASRAIPRYASEAARDAELPSPTNGQMCWVDSLKALQIRDSASTPPWQTVWAGGQDTGWLDCPITAGGWSGPSGPRWQARQIGNEVWFRGTLTNGSFSGGFTTTLTLPAGIDPPTAHAPLTLAYNSINTRAAMVQTDGEIQVYAESASTAWWRVGGSYLTD